MENTAQLQRQVEAYWDGKPCDSEFSQREKLSREFFLEVERERYRLQSHIAGIIDAIDWRGKRVLEIGTGVGTDARRIVSRGGIYTGVNVDQGSTLATAVALSSFGLPGATQQADATRLPFKAGSFDIVYTFGVLHHIPEVERAVAHVRRVLKPGGQLIAMLYNRTSINYAVEIKVLRKLGARALAVPGILRLASALGFPAQKLERHRELARRASAMSEHEWLEQATVMLEALDADRAAGDRLARASWLKDQREKLAFCRTALQAIDGVEPNPRPQRQKHERPNRCHRPESRGYAQPAE